MNRRRCLSLTLLAGMLILARPALCDEPLRVLEEPRAVGDFSLPDIDGGSHRLSDYRGKYLLVNFWAVWCTPCRKEMPSMQRAYARLEGEHFDMLAIHVGPTLDGARRFARSLSLTFPVLVDEQMTLTQWRVSGLPTTFLLDPEGRIVAEAVGAEEWDDPLMLQRLKDFGIRF